MPLKERDCPSCTKELFSSTSLE
ncbi:unnamed protein product [Linum tenue]|uniref:Uncharacterized protein n=1 Tax=Linum tenue TaxID=586396 RepID=A0AAV0HQW2_9ROSI|nr:unnamed protein product [Linum tenue]